MAFEDFLNQRSAELGTGKKEDFSSFLTKRTQYYQNSTDEQQYANLMKSAYQSNPAAFTDKNPNAAAISNIDATAEKARQLPVVGPILRTLDTIATNPVVDKVAEIGRDLFVPGASLANVGGFASAAENAVSRLVPKLGKTTLGRLASTAASEGATGATVGAGQSLYMNPDSSAQEVATQGLYGGLLGGGLGTAVRGVGELRGLLRNTPSPTPEPLALPAPKPLALREGTAPSGDVIPMPGEVKTFELPAPNITPPTTARIDRLTNPYRQKYEQLANEVQNMNARPGLEYETYQDAWSRMAGPQDPSLDQLVELAYPSKTNKLTPDLLQRARGYQESRLSAGVGLPVKTMSDRYSGFVGSADAPIDGGFRGSIRTPKSVSNDTALRISPESTPKLIPLKENGIAATSEVSPIASLDPTKLKDIGGVAAYTTDVYRNLEKVLGKDVADQILQPFNEAKKANIDYQENWLNKLKNEVVDKLGIQKGSKLSALVQQYGEKQITLDKLKEAAPNDWKKVVQADNWFRQAYDSILKDVNRAREMVYPNNPDKLIQPRQDYYRHFREMDGIEGIRNLFGSPHAIDPALAGKSEFVKPKTKWASFMQRRGNGPFKNDAVGGFLDYVPSASFSANIDPHISTFRNISNELADKTAETRNLNRFIEYLNDFSNDLAGKTNPFDRALQKVIDRRAMAAIQWVNNRVKANTILGNVGSALAQLANIPNGIAFAKQYAVKGAGESLAAIFGKETTPMAESGFLKERFAGKLYRQFDTKWLEQPKRFAEWMMETADRIGTTFVWNSAYEKGIAEKVSDPIAYADDTTRKLIAGRGIGEVPILQKARITQLLMPFQLEVANLWKVQKDFVKAKDFGAIAILFLGNYLLNRAMEKTRGNAVTFDPIQAMVEAMQPDLSPLERGGRIAGEVLSNLPGGQTISQIYPEYGATTPEVVKNLLPFLPDKLPTRKQLFGNNDPSRFGGGLLAVKGMTDPLYKIVMPFGGGQLKKTIQGISDLQKGGDYNGDALKYPIDNNAINTLRTVLFGPSSTPEAQNYYKNNLRPLSKDQTRAVENSPDQQATYQQIIHKRALDKIKSDILDIKKNKELTPAEKQSQINQLQNKLQRISLGG